MQNEQMTVRGYSPQNTGRMNTIPYQVQEQSRLQQLWQQLDPAAVALLAAAVLGLAYALFATISFWWLTQIIAHLVLVWIALLINAGALFTGKRELMLLSGICYGVAMFLFINYLYLLIPQAGLAFVTSTAALPYPGEAARHIRLDSAADAALVRCSRPRLRFALKMSAALQEEAVSSLAQAKQMHDELERLYNPHVDFDRVHQIAGEVIDEILALSK